MTCGVDCWWNANPPVEKKSFSCRLSQVHLQQSAAGIYQHPVVPSRLVVLNNVAWESNAQRLVAQTGQSDGISFCSGQALVWGLLRWFFAVGCSFAAPGFPHPDPGSFRSFFFSLWSRPVALLCDAMIVLASSPLHWCSPGLTLALPFWFPSLMCRNSTTNHKLSACKPFALVCFFFFCFVLGSHKPGYLCHWHCHGMRHDTSPMHTASACAAAWIILPFSFWHSYVGRGFRVSRTCCCCRRLRLAWSRVACHHGRCAVSGGQNYLVRACRVGMPLGCRIKTRFAMGVKHLAAYHRLLNCM